MPAVTMRRLYDELEILYKPPFRKPATWRKLRKVLSEFSSLPEVRKTSDITPIAIASWVQLYGHRAAITNRSYLGAFRAAVRYAQKMGYLKVSPWEIRSDWVPDDPPDDDDDGDGQEHERYHSDIDICRWLELLDAEALAGDWTAGRLQALGYTYALTGLRKNEALGLKVADLDLPAGVIRLKPRRKRTLKTRRSAAPVGIPDELRAVYQRWVPRVESVWLFPNTRKRSTPWLSGVSGTRPLDRVKESGARAGIAHLTIHSLRRSIATHAGRMGLSLLETRDLLRHADARTTQQFYIEEDLGNLRSTAARISYRRLAGRN